MASVREIFRSREGGGVGVFGSQNRTTIWQVTTDADGDDPVKVMWDTVGGPTTGSPFPAPDGGNKYQSWVTRDNGMVAIGFNYGRRLSRKVWEVFVTYGPPILYTQNTTAWTLSMSAGLTTEQVVFDLDGRPIGTPAMDPVDASEDGTVPEPPLGEVEYTAILSDGKKVILHTREPGIDTDTGLPTGDDDRQWFSEPATRTQIGGTVTLSRLLPKLPESVLGVQIKGGGRGGRGGGTIGIIIDPPKQTAGAMNFANKVNDDTVRIEIDSGQGAGISGSQIVNFAPPYTMKMVGVTTNQQAGTLVGQTIPGVVWRVSFTMEFNPLTWWHDTTMTYKEAGPPVLIKDDKGNRVNMRRRLYNSFSFTDLFAGFN